MALELNREERREEKNFTMHDRKCLDCLVGTVVRNVNTEGTDGEHSEGSGGQASGRKAMNAVSGNGHRHKPILVEIWTLK